MTSKDIPALQSHAEERKGSPNHHAEFRLVFFFLGVCQVSVVLRTESRNSHVLGELHTTELHWALTVLPRLASSGSPASAS